MKCFSRIKDITSFDSTFKDSPWRSMTSGNLTLVPCPIVSDSTSYSRNLWSWLPILYAHSYGWRNLFQSEGAQVHVKKAIEKSCGLNWQLWRHKHWNMTSLPIHHTKVYT